jgi:hypothetical protein
MAGEFEWENAITSADDSGEAEIEQLYVQHDFKSGLRGTAGLYLMPVGLINQNHEPTAYYGVFRADRCNPFMARVNSPPLTIWRFMPRSIGASRAYCSAPPCSTAISAKDNRAFWAMIRSYYCGMYTGGTRLPVSNSPANTRGAISHTEALNASFLASPVVNPTLVASLFWGGYLQAAYTLWQGHYFRLTPFARYEILNTAAAFGSLSAGQGGVEHPDENIWTVGASFFFGDNVVFKADYRHYQNDTFPSEIPPELTKGNSVNLGVGYSF